MKVKTKVRAGFWGNLYGGSDQSFTFSPSSAQTPRQHPQSQARRKFCD